MLELEPAHSPSAALAFFWGKASSKAGIPALPTSNGNMEPTFLDMMHYGRNCVRLKAW